MIKRNESRFSRKPMKRYMREDIDLDTKRDECQMQILELLDMLDDLKEEISDFEYFISTARRINDHDFNYGYDNCKGSIENASAYLSWIRNALR